ncbi:MAG: PAS domain S-box protein [Bacteroidales bacterium]|nr:PAS domain S-box protein [Bacteroidales bacterium]
MAFWTYSLTIVRFSENTNFIHLFSRLGTLVWVLLLPVSLHFIISFIKISIFRKPYRVIFIYLPSLFLSIPVILGKLIGIEFSGLIKTQHDLTYYTIYNISAAVYVLLNLYYLIKWGYRSQEHNIKRFSKAYLLTVFICYSFYCISFYLEVKFGYTFYLITVPIIFLLLSTGILIGLIRNRIVPLEFYFNAKTIVDAVSDGVILIDNKLIIRRVNQAFLKIAGGNSSDFYKGKNVKDILFKINKPNFIDDILKSGSVLEKVIVIEFEKDIKKTVLFSGKVFFDKNKRFNGCVFFLKDITLLEETQMELKKYNDNLELKVLERTEELDRINSQLLQEVLEKIKAQKESESNANMLKLLIETAQDAIYTVSPEGFITSINKYMCDAMGYAKDEIMGKYFAEFIHPDDVPRGIQIHEMIQLGLKPPIFELRIHHKDNHYVFAEFSTSPIIIDGKPNGTLGIGRDISERVFAQQKIRESEEKYRFLVENANDVIYLTDNVGKINFITQNVEKLIGFKADQIIGKSFFDFVFSDDLDRVRNGFSKTQFKLIDINEFRIQTKEGLIKHIRCTSNTNIENNQIIGINGIISDITAAVDAKNELKESLEEKIVLLKEVHHRVKNNLQVIIALLQLESYNTNNSETHRIIKCFVERLTSMKLVHEKLYQSENLKNIDLPNYIGDLVNHINNTYNADNSDIKLMVEVDRFHLTLDTLIPIGLVLNELITNSYKYAFPNGKGNIRIAFTKDADDIYLLTVEDDGIGYNTHNILEECNTLGLKLVKSLVCQLNGSIDIRNGNGIKYIIQFTDIYKK